MQGKRTAAMVVAVLLLAGAAPNDPRLHVPAAIVSGDAPTMHVTGVPPGKLVRLETLRRFTKWDKVDGQWREVPVVLRAWGDFRSDRAGMVDTAKAAPVAGTYRGVDPYGLFWSGRPPDDPLTAQAGPPPAAEPGGNATVVAARIEGRVIGTVTSRFAEPAGLRIATVAAPGIAGVYAAPAGTKRYPTLILLHGSEGGNAASARELATRFAGQGYAAFALTYFAWDLAGLKDVPHAHVNLPVEAIARARDWLAQQAEADVARLGVYGHSKGAEFAEVAAVRYPWIKAVVACVPTDVVWEGYGSDDERNRPEHRGPAPTQISSWSFGGMPLPYLPLRPFRLDRPEEYFDNTERYERSRAEHPERAAAAAIPLERARARVLLLGGGRDEVWASGRMTQALARRAGASRITAKVYPAAGHQICGDGTYPPRVWGTELSDPRRKNLDAEAAATVDAWRRIRAFLKATL